MKIAVGIGNPGKRYEHTRHNLGFRVIDLLAAAHGISLSRRRFDALVGEGTIGTRQALLVQPQTYVNLTGSCVAPLLRWYHCSTEDLLVVCDDLNLDLGKLRLRRQGSAGGHKGLQSIIECLGTDAFARLRIGIGRGVDNVAHVLGRLEPAEEPVMAEALAAAARIADRWLRDGLEAALSELNR